MKIEYIEEKPGVVRLTSKIGGLLTPERCIEEAKEILQRENYEILKDLGSVDLTDSMLLAQELKIHTVVFSIRGKDIVVNEKNIEEISNKLQEKKEKIRVTSNRQAIKEAVAENWGDISL